MSKRARQQERTRQRIVEAAVHLHGTVGPGETTISAIAEEAGVQRATVYRHFPDPDEIFAACTVHYNERHPWPDPRPGEEVSDPEDRLVLGLRRVYGFFSENEAMYALMYRDAHRVPELMEAAEPYFEHWDRILEILAAGWTGDEEGTDRVRTALGHALDFRTWHSLVSEQGMSDDTAVEMMVCLVRCAAGEREVAVEP